MNAPASDSIREFFGPDGAAALARTGTVVEPIGAGEFRARVTLVPLGRTRITVLEATAHRGYSAGARRDGIVLFHFQLAGTFTAHQDGEPVRGGGGTIRFLNNGASWRYTVEMANHAVVWWLKLEDLQPPVAAALRHASTIEFRDDATALSATAVIRSLIRNSPEPGSLAAHRLEEVLIAQIEAVVLAADATRLDPDRAGGLYAELRALFTADLSRRSLSWAGLAEELDTTPALISRALSAQGVTAHDLLGTMRLDALAGFLRDPRFDGSLAEAAMKSGYGGVAQAARAFRAEHGTTMGRYRALARAGRNE